MWEYEFFLLRKHRWCSTTVARGLHFISLHSLILLNDATWRKKHFSSPTVRPRIYSSRRKGIGSPYESDLSKPSHSNYGSRYSGYNLRTRLYQRHHHNLQNVGNPEIQLKTQAYTEANSVNNPFSPPTPLLLPHHATSSWITGTGPGRLSALLGATDRRLHFVDQIH